MIIDFIQHRRKGICHAHPVQNGLSMPFDARLFCMVDNDILKLDVNVKWY